MINKVTLLLYRIEFEKKESLGAFPILSFPFLSTPFHQHQPSSHPLNRPFMHTYREKSSRLPKTLTARLNMFIMRQ